MHELHHFAKGIVRMQLAGDLPNDISQVTPGAIRSIHASEMASCFRETRDGPEDKWATLTAEEFDEAFLEAYHEYVTSFNCPGIVLPTMPADEVPKTETDAVTDERESRYLWLTPTERDILAVMDDRQPLNCQEIHQRFCVAFNQANGAAAAGNEVDGVEYGTVRNLVSAKAGDLQKYGFVMKAGGKRGYVRCWKPPA